MRKTIAFTLSLLLFFSPLSYGNNTTDLPDIGPEGGLLSPSENKRFGEAFMRYVMSSQKVIADPLLSSYIQILGQQLVAASDAGGRSFHFFLVDSPQVNAFAGPGGYIGVNTGLITTTQSESELASVMSHEIAHVTQDHLVRTYNAMERMSLPMQAAAIAALVLGAATGNADAGLMTATGLQASVAQQQINFTRTHEKEADSIGIQTLAGAGFDPRAMGVFFDRLGSSNRLYDSGKLPEYLRTHPISTNRVADARGRADAYPYRQRPDSLDYHLVRATLKVRDIQSPTEAVEYFERTLKEKRYHNEEAQKYGYALALMEAKRFADASEQFDQLLSQRPEKIAYLVKQAHAKSFNGETKKAVAILESGLALYPGNYLLSIYYAELLLSEDFPDKALVILQSQIEGRASDARLYRMAARAAGNTGDKTKGHRYLAEYYYHGGNLEAAIQQLERALQDRTIDYYLDAEISARLNNIKQELQALKQRIAAE
ncbi:MAG: M48 family metallopeptidase [Gammaproteobacteria bacterium]|nr:M48 family metallopeptidase [Gammaproteobacteria bacterium]